MRSLPVLIVDKRHVVSFSRPEEVVEKIKEVAKRHGLRRIVVIARTTDNEERAVTPSELVELVRKGRVREVLVLRKEVAGASATFSDEIAKKIGELIEEIDREVEKLTAIRERLVEALQAAGAAVLPEEEKTQEEKEETTEEPEWMIDWSAEEEDDDEDEESEEDDYEEW